MVVLPFASESAFCRGCGKMISPQIMKTAENAKNVIREESKPFFLGKEIFILGIVI